MATFGKWLTVAIIALASVTFTFGVLFQNFQMDEMFLAAVGLAVAGIPEGLPAWLNMLMVLLYTSLAIFFSYRLMQRRRFT